MLATLILATLGFTTPIFNQLPDTTCGIEDKASPIADLDHVTLYGTARNRTQVQVLARKLETLTGYPDTITFPDSGLVWTVWVTFSDHTGNESCPSNLMGLNLTASVPGPPRIQDWNLYDLMGRRLGGMRAMSLEQALAAARARPPGAYLLRSQDGKTQKRVTVLR